MASEHDLIIVGAGAKAAGIATKVHILNSLGLAQLSVKIVEGTEVAASWKGRYDEQKSSLLGENAERLADRSEVVVRG